MTLRDVANEAEVSIAYLSDLERAVLTNPTLGTLRRIAQALEISIDDLLGGGDAATPRASQLPPALAAFSEDDAFKTEIEAQARRSRRDPDELRQEWLQVLEAIEIGGRRPSAPYDYLFIFESIRRAVTGK
jgi:transcriptional regulator with XRE-family HTH domain